MWPSSGLHCTAAKLSNLSEAYRPVRRNNLVFSSCYFSLVGVPQRSVVGFRLQSALLGSGIDRAQCDGAPRESVLATILPRQTAPL